MYKKQSFGEIRSPALMKAILNFKSGSLNVSRPLFSEYNGPDCVITWTNDSNILFHFGKYF